MEEDDVPGLKLNLVVLQLCPGQVNPVQLGPSLSRPTAADQDVVKPPHLVGPSQHLIVERLHQTNDKLVQMIKSDSSDLI